MKNDEDAEHYDRSMSNEAERAITQIKFGILTASVSEELEKSDMTAFINIRTLEMKDYCIELTMSGYQIVAEKFNSIDSDLIKHANNAEISNCYESIDALMLKISPLYVAKFNNALADKLNNLL